MTPLCRCSTPDPDVTAEGVAYCRECGHRIPDPRQKTRDSTLSTVARVAVSHNRRIAKLEADRSNGKPARPIPRVTLTRAEAAVSLGMSVDHFERHVQPELRVVRCGQLVLIPVIELERFAERHMERPLSEQV